MDQQILLFLLFIPGFLFSMSFHEAAHAFMAYRLGDSTAKYLGRMTLNPIPHIDPLGTLILPAVGFLTGIPILAWAKPVPFDPRNLKNIRRDSMYIALAGPLSNFLLMFIFAGLIYVFDSFGMLLLTWGVSQNLVALMYFALQMTFVFNVVLFLFNFLPFDPLDGGKIIRGVLPHKMAVKFDHFMRRHQTTIMIVLVILIFTGYFGKVIFPVIRFISVLFLGSRFTLF